MTSITLSGLQRALHFDMRNTFRFLIRVFSPPDMEFPTVEQIIEDLAAAPVDDILFQPETLTKTGITFYSFGYPNKQPTTAAT
eukprot:m.90974 g.90974  ORF g.90974 m.90974 type:complete len:83 (+) comp36673_c0_seq12:3367-3615(+)